MKHLIIGIGMILTASFAQAQVKGIVTDKEQEPIIGANIIWMNTSEGTTTDVDGHFELKKPKGADHLIVSYIGYESDTLRVKGKNETLNVVLDGSVLLDEVNIVSRKVGLSKLRNSVINSDMISAAELCRAACCNLGESFVTNPSVDVSYSDAATGAKQIKLLGLSGTYVQMLTENIPNFRGAASAYGLGYVPGPWMESIQVSKGTSSVKNGYEALTGQINLEYKKPQTADIVSANLFAATSQRYEANVDASVHLNKNLSTMILAHYENETQSHDGNGDGFMDLPALKQYNLQNRWAHSQGNNIFQGGIRVLQEDRTSGQMHAENPYRISIQTDRYEAFLKNGYIIDREKNTSVALMASGSIHKQNSFYGKKLYDVDQKNAYASLLFETEFTPSHSLSTGLSFNFDEYDQQYLLTPEVDANTQNAITREAVSGAYAQYTYNLNKKLVLMAGVRGDYSSEYGFFVTPRAHVKYAPNDIVNFRLSAGKGYRMNHVLAENNFLLASSRKIVIVDNLRQEEAWNYGASVSTYIPLFGKTLNINAEYYYTDFLNQVVIDMETPFEVNFTNLSGRSYSQNFQIEASYPFFQGFTLTAAYRLTDAKVTYNGVLKEKPLTGKYKGLLTASYQTPLGLWQFDATLQLNGGGRMPTAYNLADGSPAWEPRYKGFEQVSAQVTRYFRRWSVYVGGENLTNFKQKNPIIGADQPWGDTFDSTMVWGPVHGVKGYVGVRFNLARN